MAQRAQDKGGHRLSWGEEAGKWGENLMYSLQAGLKLSIHPEDSMHYGTMKSGWCYSKYSTKAMDVHTGEVKIQI